MNALLLMTFLVVVQLALAAFFIAALITGKANNFLLGTTFGVEFLLLGLMIVLYLRAALPPREVAEDRDEGLLW